MLHLANCHGEITGIIFLIPAIPYVAYRLRMLIGV